MLLGTALATLVLMISPTQGMSSAGPCEKAGVKSLYIAGLDEWGWDDQCARAPEKYNTKWFTLIDHVYELNQMVAHHLNISLPALFNQNLSLTLEDSPKGSLGSFVDGSTNELVLTDFINFQGTAFNDKTYVHELTHWITTQAGNPISAKIGSLADHEVMVETLADWLSAEVTGETNIGLKLMSADAVPSCLKDIRSKVSFNDASSHFHYGFNIEEQKQCCLNNTFTDSRLLSYCDSVNQDIVEDQGNLIPKTKQWKLPFDPVVCREVTPAGEVTMRGCDPHQFSSALMPFILDVKKIHPEFNFLYFLKISESLLRDSPNQLYPLFRNIRNFLPQKNKAAFDVLWEKYNLNILGKIDLIKNQINPQR